MKPRKYSGPDFDIEYDLKRCIHTAECVKGLPAVFDPDRKPWVDPSRANLEDVLRVVDRCPTGALVVRAAGVEKPKAPANALVAQKDGPLYVRGDIRLKLIDGAELQETRVALCRCGESANKPFCDGKHADAGFEAAGTEQHPNRVESGCTGALTIEQVDGGPLRFHGEYVWLNDVTCVKKADGALCRCGASDDKPFCDGTHVVIGFED